MTKKISYGKFTPHPVADMFPLMEGAEFDELVVDIKQHGLRDPIVTLRDWIIDGRNRFLAANVAGTTLRFKPYSGPTDEASIADFISSHNLPRRNLNPGQKTAIGLSIQEWKMANLKEQAKTRQRAGQSKGGKKGGGDRTSAKAKASSPRNRGDAARKEDRSGRVDNILAQQIGVSTSTVHAAKKVRAADPKLNKQVMEGKISLNAAHKKVKEKEAAETVREETGEFIKTNTIKNKPRRATAMILSKKQLYIEYDALREDDKSIAGISGPRDFEAIYKKMQNMQTTAAELLRVMDRFISTEERVTIMRSFLDPMDPKDAKVPWIGFAGWAAALERWCTGKSANVKAPNLRVVENSNG